MPEIPGAGQGSGMLGRLRHLLDTISAVLCNRLQLAALELREEFTLWLGAFLLAAMAFFLGQLGLLLLTLALVALFPEHAAVILGMAGLVFLAAAISCVVTLRQRLRDRPPPFEESSAELKKDREWLSTLN
jgi:uncharacterized membrane protein YqjE